MFRCLWSLVDNESVKVCVIKNEQAKSKRMNK